MRWGARCGDLVFEMHGVGTMTRMEQDICKALSEQSGKGVTVFVFTCASGILKSSFWFSVVKKTSSGIFNKPSGQLKQWSKTQKCRMWMRNKAWAQIVSLRDQYYLQSPLWQIEKCIIVSAQLLSTSDWYSIQRNSDCAGFVTQLIVFHLIKWCVQGYSLESFMSLQFSHLVSE